MRHSKAAMGYRESSCGKCHKLRGYALSGDSLRHLNFI
jgi:hypothetical protein